jgi:hypothetical protein
MLEDIAARSADPEQGRDPVQDWLERKVQENIAGAQQRQREADEIAAGTRPGPTGEIQTELGRATARGLVTTTANTLKGAAYGYQYARRGTMSEAAETKIYELAAVIDEWARQTFPNDPARQHEMSVMLAEGTGSMVTFMGPGLAASMLTRGGPTLLAWLATAATSGTTGALAQSGAMTDDALRAMRAGRTVGGEPVTEEMVRRVFPWAAFLGATEAAPIAHFLNRTGGTLALNVITQMIEEGGQEFVQQVGENVVARSHYDDLRQWDDNAWSGLAVGAILGGSMGGAGYHRDAVGGVAGGGRGARP